MTPPIGIVYASAVRRNQSILIRFSVLHIRIEQHCCVFQYRNVNGSMPALKLFYGKSSHRQKSI